MPPFQHFTCMVSSTMAAKAIRMSTVHPAGRARAVQRKAEIDEHEQLDRNHVGKQRCAVGEEVEGEAAEPDEKDERDEEVMVGAPHLPRTAEQQQRCGKCGKQKGRITCRVQRLGEQRLVRPPLAIEEHVLLKLVKLPFPR